MSCYPLKFLGSEKGSQSNVNSHSEKKSLSVRQKLDKGHRHEQILKNPLAIHSQSKSEALPSEKYVVKKSSSNEQAASTRKPSDTLTSHCEGSSETTSNHVQSGFEVFADESADTAKKVKKQPQKSSVNSSGARFNIFSDVSSEGNMGKNDKTVSSPNVILNKSSHGFVIFTDDNEHEPSKNKGATNKNSGGDAADISAPATNLDTDSTFFTNSERGVDLSITRNHDNNKKKVETLNQHADQSPFLKNKEDQHENEADFNFLDLSGGENETINTKLAKIDIDQMFICEPTPEKTLPARKPRKKCQGSSFKQPFTIYNPDDQVMSPVGPSSKQPGSSSEIDFHDDDHSNNNKNNNSMVYFDDSLLQFEATTEMPIPLPSHTISTDIDKSESVDIDIFNYTSAGETANLPKMYNNLMTVPEEDEDVFGGNDESRRKLRGSLYVSSSDEDTAESKFSNLSYSILCALILFVW